MTIHAIAPAGDRPVPPELALLRAQLERAREERLAELHAKERLAHRLQSLLDVMPAGVVVLDGFGQVQECNPTAVELLGTPLKGEAWRHVMIRAFDPTPGHDLRLRDGRMVHLSTCPLGGDPGQMLLLQDVTDSRLLQQRVEHHRRLADMGRMAANLAHQIRTPLASALLYASQLRQPGVGEERRHRFAEKAVAGLKQLEQLVNDMLLFARGEVEAAELLPVRDLLEQALSGSKPLMEEAAIRAELTGGEGVEVRGNRAMLVSALRNLIDNAVEAVGKGGCIRLAAQLVPQGGVDLLVQDDGAGVPEAIRATLFEPFQTTRSNGTGLGLAVVRMVARAHGGEAWFRSDAEKGSVFAMRLPHATPAQGGGPCL